MFNGVVLLRATGAGLKEIGRLSVAEDGGMAQRSLIIGDVVYLLSDRALQAHSLDTLRRIDRLALA